MRIARSRRHRRVDFHRRHDRLGEGGASVASDDRVEHAQHGHSRCYARRYLSQRLSHVPHRRLVRLHIAASDFWRHDDSDSPIRSRTCADTHRTRARHHLWWCADDVPSDDASAELGASRFVFVAILHKRRRAVASAARRKVHARKEHSLQTRFRYDRIRSGDFRARAGGCNSQSGFDWATKLFRGRAHRGRRQSAARSEPGRRTGFERTVILVRLFQ